MQARSLKTPNPAVEVSLQKSYKVCAEERQLEADVHAVILVFIS